MKILIVDDDESIVKNLKQILEELGHIVDVAYTGMEALEKVKQNKYEVALIDLLLPDIDGIQVLIEVNNISPTTAIIIITAFGTIPNAVEAIKRGASNYITKPFRVDELLATIKKAVEEKKLIYEADEKTLSIFSHPIRRNIILLLAKHRSMKFTDMVRALEIDDPPRLSYHLKILKDAGIISQNNQRLYILTRRGAVLTNKLMKLKHSY